LELGDKPNRGSAAQADNKPKRGSRGQYSRSGAVEKPKYATKAKKLPKSQASEIPGKGSMSPRDNEVKVVDAAASLPPETPSQQGLPVDRTGKGGKPKAPNPAQIAGSGPPKTAPPPNKNYQEQKDDAVPATRERKEDERQRATERKKNPTPAKQRGSGGRGPRGNRPKIDSSDEASRKAKEDGPSPAGVAKPATAKPEVEVSEPKAEQDVSEPKAEQDVQ
jgi:hypothetical protein